MITGDKTTNKREYDSQNNLPFAMSDSKKDVVYKKQCNYNKKVSSKLVIKSFSIQTGHISCLGMQDH